MPGDRVVALYYVTKFGAAVPFGSVPLKTPADLLPWAKPAKPEDKEQLPLSRGTPVVVSWAELWALGKKDGELTARDHHG